MLLDVVVEVLLFSRSKSAVQRLVDLPHLIAAISRRRCAIKVVF